MTRVFRTILSEEEFRAYRDELFRKAEDEIAYTGAEMEAAFQGAVAGIISTERSRVFTGEQVARLIITVLEHKKERPCEAATSGALE